jgi:hypothetical protein
MELLMKTNRIIPTALLMTTVAFTGSLFTGSAAAHSKNECNIDLNNGVTISPESVKVFNDDKTLFTIQQNGDMSVNGQPVALTSEQQQISAQYVSGLQTVVPNAVNVAFEAIDVATIGVNTAMTTLFGSNSEIEEKITNIIASAREKISDKMERSGDVFTISPHSLNDLENAFDEEFEKEVEEVAMSSMGSVFTLIGDAMSSGTGTFEQRMEAFGKKMERMGEELQMTLKVQTDRLEEQTEQLCHQLKDIDTLETQLQEQVPQFASYNLLDMDEHAE